MGDVARLTAIRGDDTRASAPACWGHCDLPTAKSDVSAPCSTRGRDSGSRGAWSVSHRTGGTRTASPCRRRSRTSRRHCRRARYGLPACDASAPSARRRRPRHQRGLRTDGCAAGPPPASKRGSAAARARSRCSWDLTPPVVGHDLGHSAVAQMSEGVARESGPPRPRSTSRTRKAPPCGAFRSAPKRTRTSTRLSRTRPSTWRVYQFRHRREGGGEYSPGCRTANGRAVSRAGSTGPCELSPSDGRSTVCEHMFAQVDQPAVKAI